MKKLFGTVTLLALLAVPALARQPQQPSGPVSNRNDRLLAFNPYISVRLEVAAPDEWSATIRSALEAKLNAVPDVQVVEDPDAAMFTILVDVNAITDKSDNLLGYSLAATIYGSYDERILSAIFDELAKSSDVKAARTFQLMRYAISGNVFLAGVLHTHGSTQNIDAAYDQIVSELKSNGLPEARKMLTMLASLLRDEPKIEGPTSY